MYLYLRLHLCVRVACPFLDTLDSLITRAMIDVFFLCKVLSIPVVACGTCGMCCSSSASSSHTSTLSAWSSLFRNVQSSFVSTKFRSLAYIAFKTHKSCCILHSHTHTHRVAHRLRHKHAEPPVRPHFNLSLDTSII